MTVVVSNPYCVPCEDYTNWVELIIRDEHNQPFPNINGTLTDGSGKRFPVVIGQAPILLKNIAVGWVRLELDNQAWLKETQQRMPYEFKDGETKTPTELWYDENKVGYEGAEREFFTVAIGDFIKLEQGQTLPKRHEAGGADKWDVIHNISAVVQIQGFRAVTLRFGMFFDGTANHTYSARWGKSHFDNVQQSWVKDYRTLQAVGEKIPDRLLDYEKVTGEKVNSAAANELTNVQKLFDLYADDEFSEDGKTFYHREYITGIGTDNNTAIVKAEESGLFGQGLGLGDWGVAGKTRTATETLCNSLSSILDSVGSKEIDAITKVEFDVFGFSRGSAAARHFVNLVLDGKDNPFVAAFEKACERENLAFVGGFDWANNDHCQIKFAGLFDTVASIINPLDFDLTTHNDDNDPVRLYLDPARVERAVHFVANRKTEYRSNFGVNLLNTDGGGQFTEVRLLGAHSDIGGGYHSKVAFGDDDHYLLPRLENKLIATEMMHEGVFSNYEKTKSKLKPQLEQHLQREVAQGWDERNYVYQFERKYFGQNSRSVVGRLVYINSTQGDLSRLYLRAMYGLAEHAGVPVSETPKKAAKPIWNSTESYWQSYFPVPEKLFTMPSRDTFAFGELCDKVLQEAKQGKLNTLMAHSDERARKLFVSLGLIHHSSDTALTAVVKANKPDDSEEQWQQRENEVRELNKHEYARMEYACNKDS
ncbi:phospholipase effector Tle1 domain-containing protein [Vibrio owensii]|uniref:phospholipase effector Tle1 domain-containing protein n=1 Tax=Vibrio owensii TaxID=696485 RepID=UPI003AAA441B